MVGIFPYQFYTKIFFPNENHCLFFLDFFPLFLNKKFSQGNTFLSFVLHARQPVSSSICLHSPKNVQELKPIPVAFHHRLICQLTQYNTKCNLDLIFEVEHQKLYERNLALAERYKVWYG